MRHAGLVALTLLAAPAASQRVHGITVSTHRSGQEWGSDQIEPTFAALRALGADWVAIHPYAGIQGDGSVRWSLDPAAPPLWLRRPITTAHALGLKILVIPHLAEWGSPFRYKGEIEFHGPQAWQRFWVGYRGWLSALADICADADAISVGCELDRTLAHEREWRMLIDAVRARTQAALTYAANWTDYERVPFWDAVDAIGIQAYFPLSEQSDPDSEQLRRAWRARLDQVRAFSERKQRHVVFTELGYSRSFTAAARPWEYASDDAAAAALQQRCLHAALTEIEQEPRVVGMFLWKWFCEPRPVGRNFQLATPGMRAVIAGAWLPQESPRAR